MKVIDFILWLLGVCALGGLLRLYVFPYDPYCVGYWTNCTNTYDWTIRECYIDCITLEEYLHDIILVIISSVAFLIVLIFKIFKLKRRGEEKN